jgi:DNA-binding MarR family transcriptional regulator
MLDGLVSKRRVTRREHLVDRRRLTLALAPQGRAMLKSARKAAQAALAERLARLSAPDRATVAKAMDLLERLFAAKRKTRSV